MPTNGRQPAELPPGIQPRGFSLGQAAAYCGVCVEAFWDWRKRGLMPEPWPGTKRWDRLAIDRRLDKLSGIDALSAEQDETQEICREIVNGLRAEAR